MIAHLSSEPPSLPGPRNQAPGPGWSKLESRLEKACRALLAVLWSSRPSPGTRAALQTQRVRSTVCGLALAQPTQLTKQITKYIFSLFFLNEIFFGCIIYRIPANCSLAFFPRKENISSDFPHTRPHPAGCRPRLPSRLGVGLLLLWRKAGMYHCPGAAWAAVSGVDAALMQGGVHPGVGGWKSVSGGGVGRNCADSGAAGSCPGTSRHRNRASVFTRHPLILSESPNNYTRWVGHISLLFPCN